MEERYILRDIEIEDLGELSVSCARIGCVLVEERIRDKSSTPQVDRNFRVLGPVLIFIHLNERWIHFRLVAILGDVLNLRNPWLHYFVKLRLGVVVPDNERGAERGAGEEVENIDVDAQLGVVGNLFDICGKHIVKGIFRSGLWNCQFCECDRKVGVGLQGHGPDNGVCSRTL